MTHCPSCEHGMDIHDADGRCWFTVASGLPDSNLVCPCKIRKQDVGDVAGFREVHVSPHRFERRGWRFWICTHCFAPRSLHPRTAWARSRPPGTNYYLSGNAPHFDEGW